VRLPQRIEPNVPGHAKQIGAAGDGGFETVAVLQRPHERVLQEILGGTGQRRLMPEIGQQSRRGFAVKLLQ